MGLPSFRVNHRCGTRRSPPSRGTGQTLSRLHVESHRRVLSHPSRHHRHPQRCGLCSYHGLGGKPGKIRNFPHVTPPGSHPLRYGLQVCCPKADLLLFLGFEPRGSQGECNKSSGVASLTGDPIIQAPTRSPRKSSIYFKPDREPPWRSPHSRNECLPRSPLPDAQSGSWAVSIGNPIVHRAPHLVEVTTAQRGPAPPRLVKSVPCAGWGSRHGHRLGKWAGTQIPGARRMGTHLSTPVRRCPGRGDS